MGAGASRFDRLTGAALAVLALASTWARAQEPASLHPRIVAVGDLHGDFAAWRDIALAAGLIDAQGRWAGNKAVFVQAGDVIDRGPDGRRIELDLMRLQREAKRAGGQVIALVGNHEAMNMTGDLRYVSPADFAAYANANSGRLRDQTYAANRAAIAAFFRKSDPTLSADGVRQAWYGATPLGWLEHKLAWAPTGEIGGWVAGNPAVVLMDGVIFVHGGISAAYSATPIAEINARVAKALTAQDASPAAIINDPEGPLWYRGLVLPRTAPESDAATPDGSKAPSASIEAELSQVLKAYGARRMVIAHTPLLSGIAILYDGRLARIDTGISNFYGGKLSYLDIVDGQPAAHIVKRSKPAGAP